MKDKLQPQTFGSVLKAEIERLKTENRFANEADIARRAEIDPTTFSVLKTDKNERLSLIAKYRVQLAVVCGKSFEEMSAIAERFLAADPKIEGHEPKLRSELVKFWVRSLQNEIHDVEIGIPHFFDTSPLVVAERHGFFRDANLNVKLDYVKWSRSLEYLQPNNVGDKLVHGNGDVAELDDPASENGSQTVRLTVYNHESIFSKGRVRDVTFCFPLGIYDPSNFVMWARGGDDGILKPEGMKLTWDEKLRAIYAERKDKLRVIVSGEDMRQGTILAFTKAGIKENIEKQIVTLDQFDGPEAFSSGLGDLWVGGVPQNAAVSGEELFKIVDGSEFGWPTQFNGLVCRQTDIDRDAVRKLVVQILWCWYRALRKIDRSLQEESSYVVSKMNVFSERVEYTESKFTDFWERRKETFDLPLTPFEMVTRIHDSKDYSYRIFDWTSQFAKDLIEMESVFSIDIDEQD